jgi:hypothetical protein
LSLRGRAGFGIGTLLVILLWSRLWLSLRRGARLGLRAILLLRPLLDLLRCGVNLRGPGLVLRPRLNLLRGRVYLCGPGLILGPVLLLIAGGGASLLLAGLNLCGLCRVDVIVVGAGLLLSIVNLIVAAGVRLVVAGLGLVSALLLRRLGHGHGARALDVAIGLYGLRSRDDGGASAV